MNDTMASILIVEDELVTAENMKSRLEEEGFSVCGIADSADSAVSLAKATSPHLILMDIVLKNKSSGITAAREILLFLDVPVLFLTAYTDSSIFTKARETGPYGYISKPYDEKDLFRSIDIALYKHSMDRKLRASELRYRKLVEYIPHFICRFDAAFILTFVNDLYCSYAGRTCEELLGASFLDNIPVKVRESVQGNIKSLTIDRPILAYENEIIMPDNSVRWQRWTHTAIFNPEGTLEEYQSIGEDITALRLLEQEVVRATDEERRRISRDLHDDLGQRLSYLGFVAEMHKNELSGCGYANLKNVDSMIRLVRESVDHTRLIAKGLQPVALDPGGFVEAVREYAVEMKRLLNVGVQVDCKSTISIRDQFVAEHLFYIVREAINNAAKHGAKRGVIVVAMGCRENGLIISISNKIGRTNPDHGATKGMGLDIMRHRANLEALLSVLRRTRVHSGSI